MEGFGSCTRNLFGSLLPLVGKLSSIKLQVASKALNITMLDSSLNVGFKHYVGHGDSENLSFVIGECEGIYDLLFVPNF
jgi:hypothetical protein